MEHDGLVEKPRVEKPPDSDDDVLDEVALDMYITVWKFHDFSIIQIFNFRNFWEVKNLPF